MEESRESRQITPEEEGRQESAAAVDGAVTEEEKVSLEEEVLPPSSQSGQGDGPDASEQEPESETEAESGLATAAEIRRGDILSGTIKRVEDDHVLVGVGGKVEGVIPRSELTLGPNQNPKELFEEGERIYVYVLSVDGRDGALLLSERRARAERVWDDLQEIMETSRVIKGPVVEAVKGGLVIDVGVRAFMPASHIERGYVHDLNQYVGKTVRARVIELDAAKHRVILSQKVVLEEEHRKRREETWASLEEGEIRRGIVKGITDFGAFIDLGGVDGLLHVSEMAWGRVEHPSQVLQEGEEIETKVLKLDRERERISLSRKQVLPDPWEGVLSKYPPDSIVEGKVMRLAPFGVFIELEPGVEGLVHISQLADHHVKTPDEVVQEGQRVQVKILKTQPEERRISLSIKEAQKEADPKKMSEQPHPEPTAEKAEKTEISDEVETATTVDAEQTPEEKELSSHTATPMTSSAPAATAPKANRPKERRSKRESSARREWSAAEPSLESNQRGEGITLGEMFGELFLKTKERLEQQMQEEENAIEAETAEIDGLERADQGNEGDQAVEIETEEDPHKEADSEADSETDEDRR